MRTWIYVIHCASFLPIGWDYPANWAGYWLHDHLDPGETPYATILLRDNTGRVRVSYQLGPNHAFASRLSIAPGIDLDTNQTLAHFLGEREMQRIPIIITPEPLDVDLGKSRFGGFRPAGEMYQARKTAAQELMTKDKRIIDVIEARLVGHCNRAMVMLDGDEYVYVVEWGESEDGPYFLMTELRQYNRQVMGFNDSL